MGKLPRRSFERALQEWKQTDPEVKRRRLLGAPEETKPSPGAAAAKTDGRGSAEEEAQGLHGAPEEEKPAPTASAAKTDGRGSAGEERQRTLPRLDFGKGGRGDPPGAAPSGPPRAH